MLDSHPKLAADQELFLPNIPNPVATLEKSYKKVVKPGQRFVIKDAMAMHVNYLARLEDLLGKDFYFILIKRNPYDSLISYAKTNTVRNFDLFANKFVPAYKWIKKHNWHDGRYMEVKYEALVAKPGKTLRSICEFVKIPFDKQMVEYHKKTGGRKKIMVNHHSDHQAKKPLFKGSVNQFDSYCKKHGFKPTKGQLAYCSALASLLGYNNKG